MDIDIDWPMLTHKQENCACPFHTLDPFIFNWWGVYYYDILIIHNGGFIMRLSYIFQSSLTLP